MTKSQLLAVCVAVLTVLGGWAYKTRTGAVTPPPELAGVEGVRLFFYNNCVQCHSVSGVEGAKGTLGPSLDGIADRAANRVEGLSARDYLEESILEPGAHLPEGYLNAMPSYKDQLSERDLDSLVDWLVTLKEPS